MYFDSFPLSPSVNWLGLNNSVPVMFSHGHKYKFFLVPKLLEFYKHKV